jgi:glycosyltransferase involved in cell wall biosynthesis
MPDAWVTITDEMARMLRQRGAMAPIRIVYNGVDIDRFCQGDKKLARDQLKLPQDRVLLGVIGRIEFRQKQQHLLVEAVAGDEELSRQCHLVFAGDGPDASRLSDMLNGGRVSGTMISWCDPAPLYRALDAVLIPSRYEGLPLVMLEALASGTAVMGSDRDGMKDLLAGEYRFDAESLTALRQCLKNWLRSGMPAAAEELKNRVRSEMSLAAFAASFSHAIEAEKANSFFSKSG